jgi:hypothetical protein
MPAGSVLVGVPESPSPPQPASADAPTSAETANFSCIDEVFIRRVPLDVAAPEVRPAGVAGVEVGVKRRVW